MHVPHFLFRSARHAPANTLWLLPDRRITYAQGAARVARLAHALLSRAPQRSRVAYLSANRFEGLEVYLATMAAGMAVVPMNPRGVAEEYAFQLQDSGASVCFYSEEFKDMAAAIRALAPSVAHWVAIGRGHAGDTPHESLLDGRPETPPEIGMEPDDVAWLFYTSGTTGKPKGAMETHRNLVTMTQQFLAAVTPDVAPTDVMFHAAPISHGSASCMWPHLAVGAANAFPLTLQFDAVRVLEAIERYRVTSSFMPPTMVNLLVQCPERTRYDASSLKNIVYGGGPMYVEHLKAALDAFGPVFVQIFGQGEAPVTCTWLPKAEHVTNGHPVKERRLGSAGRETPGTRVRIHGPDDAPLPPGQPGEICVRGDLVMRGYWNRPDATAETLRGGWLHTGDVGYLDEDGYLFITDRMKDLIISGGANIYPREVEEVLLTHPAVRETAVFGVPDDKWGEAVKATVVLHPGRSAGADELIAHCRAHLASYKKPKSIDFVDALPKNATGKILKRQLRDAYWRDSTRKV
ncbi:MAG: long-chain fatty acid--CoA ligase [Alphaproteobacteria bacterium]|nr:long-chain fatty acid--CoA ligase [Alphaproteobacteria bacterium]